MLAFTLLAISLGCSSQNQTLNAGTQPRLSRPAKPSQRLRLTTNDTIIQRKVCTKIQRDDFFVCFSSQNCCKVPDGPWNCCPSSHPACCEDEGGKDCCPSSHPVCCADGIHCCPKNHDCIDGGDGVLQVTCKSKG